jgi:mRNA interferase MazF
MTGQILKGDIYYASLDPTCGSEQGGLRPVLVVQNNKGNTHSPTLIVLPITSREKPELPTHVPLGSFCGLTENSIAMAEQIRTIDKSRLHRYVGNVGETLMESVETALLAALEIRRKKRDVRVLPLLPVSPQNVVTLCSTCRGQYRDAGYSVQRISKADGAKHTCDYCNTRTGFDYEVSEVMGDDDCCR